MNLSGTLKALLFIEVEIRFFTAAIPRSLNSVRLQLNQPTAANLNSPRLVVILLTVLTISSLLISMLIFAVYITSCKFHHQCTHFTVHMVLDVFFIDFDVFCRTHNPFKNAKDRDIIDTECSRESKI